MATGTGNLPNQNMDFVPLAELPASDLDKLVENIESLADCSGIGDGAIDTIAVADGAITNAKLSTTAGEIGGAWTTANPTFDVTTFDNGSGGQPQILRSKYTKIGKTVHVQFKISGVKAGTNGFIKTTAWALPAAASLPSGTYCGQCGYDNGNIYTTDMAVVYRSDGVWWFSQTVNITDNQTMPGLSGTFTYEAA